MAERKTWADYPYEFSPTKTLSAKEQTELLRHLFGMKAFPNDFVQGLPDDLKKHFKVRVNAHEKPNFLKGDNNV